MPVIMDSTVINSSSSVHVQGSPGQESKVDNCTVEEVHNQSGDSTDSLKENQSENIHSSQSLPLNNSAKLSKQPFATTGRQSLTSGGTQLLQTTCNDSVLNLSSDDDSFADCPSSFNNSPYVNKPLLLGDAQRPSHARQSLGMDALVNNMGKFTFDQSIVGAANTTVDVVAEVEEPPLAAELRIAEGEEIREGQSPTVEEVNEEVNLSEPSPTLEAEEDENQSVVNDVEMMSIVMEGGELADYSNVALPEDDGAPFPDSPPPPLTVETTPEVAEANEVKEQNESVTSPVVAEVTIPKDVQFEEESSVMEVDVTQSAVGEGVETESVPEEVKSPEQEVSVVSPEVQPVISPEVKAVIDVKPEVERDFKVPTMLRKSLTSQPSQVVANPFDGMPTGVVDHKQELFFSSKDFDFLQNKETANSLSTAIKDSVLLKFDPLINQPVLVESSLEALGSVAPKQSAAYPPIPAAVARLKQQQRKKDEHGCQHALDCSREGVHNILEERLDDLEAQEDEDSLLEIFGVVRSQQAATGKSENCDGINYFGASFTASATDGGPVQDNCPTSKLVDVTMSLVDVNNDSNLSVANKTIGGAEEHQQQQFNYSANRSHNNISATTNGADNSNLSNIQFEEVEQHSKLRMSVDGGHHHNTSNGEVKIRNERYEDMDRKLKEMEEKEEVWAKRLSEKEKQIAKMTHIVEEYERSIATLMKERAIKDEAYEKRCMELEIERNANYHHLSSLETTFSDLHAKYERSKQLMENYKKSEEVLLAEKKQSAEQSTFHELRYEKLKSHAMTQMDIANTRLRDESAHATQEISRLKALLKKEEITRHSVQEQLHQKTREIEELMKIWDELKSDA